MSPNPLHRVRLAALSSPQLINLVMGCVMVVIGLLIHAQHTNKAPSELEYVRAWAREVFEQPHALMGVRRLSRSSLKGYALTTYLAVPCVTLCGVDEACQAQCQREVLSWNPTERPSFEARYLVALTDPQGKRVGRLHLNAQGTLHTLHISRQKRLMTLTQTRRRAPDLVLIYELPEPPSELSGLTEREQGMILPPLLKLRAKTTLGSINAYDETGRSRVSVEDIDEDGELEWMLLEERFASLSPTPLALTLPYHLTPQGLTLNRRLIKVTPPSQDERRTWLIKHLNAPSPTPALTYGSTPFFLALSSLCFKGSCKEANELAALAYPQDQRAHAQWTQLRDLVKRALQDEERDEEKDEEKD